MGGEACGGRLLAFWQGFLAAPVRQRVPVALAFGVVVHAFPTRNHQYRQGVTNDVQRGTCHVHHTVNTRDEGQTFQGVSESMFKVTHMIMNYAPIGVFALIAVTVANFGFASLVPLAKLVLLVYGAILFFAVAVLGLIAKLFGFSVFKLIRIFKDELVLAYSTASSETVLPRVIEKMEAYGCPKAICSFVVPTGYSFNLDGSTLYQSIAAIFIAQLYGIDLSISQQLLLVLTLMVTSKGIAGVPGVSFVVLLATLGSVGIPLEGLAFIAGVDRVMDMARTALNVIGNALAVLVISRWEGMYDNAKGERYWNSLPHWRSKEALPKGE